MVTPFRPFERRSVTTNHGGAMLIKGYVCNPNLKTVTPVTFKKDSLLKEMYEEIGCRLVERISVTGDDLSGYVDEEGSFKHNVQWTFNGYELWGNVVLLGRITGSGAETSCKLTQEQVAALCDF
jgi:hypothetical protein